MTFPRTAESERRALEWFGALTVPELLRCLEEEEVFFNEFWSYCVKLAERDGVERIIGQIPERMLAQFLQTTEMIMAIPPSSLDDATLPPFQDIGIFAAVAESVRRRLRSVGG